MSWNWSWWRSSTNANWQSEEPHLKPSAQTHQDWLPWFHEKWMVSVNQRRETRGLQNRLNIGVWSVQFEIYRPFKVEELKGCEESLGMDPWYYRPVDKTLEKKERSFEELENANDNLFVRYGFLRNWWFVLEWRFLITNFVTRPKMDLTFWWDDHDDQSNGLQRWPRFLKVVHQQNATLR